VLRQFESDPHQVQREHRHPAGAIRLAEVGAIGEGLIAIENSDVVQTKEAALKEVAPMKIFLVDPPGEVEQQLLENLLEKNQVSRGSSGFCLRRCLRSISKTRQAAHACTGGLASEKFHS
jgi:hypothetical protein